VVVLGLLSACGDAAAPIATTTLTEEGIRVPAELAAFPTDEILLASPDGDRPLTVAIAATPLERSQGLMRVDDLLDLDGMLFVFDVTTSTTFTMRDTLLPLDIAFFAGDGALVAKLQMEPCGDLDPCPSYASPARFRFALEAPQGELFDLPPETSLLTGEGGPYRP
jgi:uncharacterized membrane protein (UPF0127 family)